MRSPRRIGAVAACSLAILTTGCSESPTRPAAGNLAGNVRSSSNQPVGGAVVEVRYTLLDPAATKPRPRPSDLPPGVPAPPVVRTFGVSNNPCELGSFVIRLGVPVDARCTIRVLDPSGAVRRVLAQRTFVAGQHTLVWDGHDDADQPLPANLYTIAWNDVEGDSVFDFSAKALWHPEDPNQGANTATLSNGTFSIPFDDLAIGGTFEARDVADSLLGPRVIAYPITVLASGLVGGVVRSGQVVVDEAHRKDLVRIVLQ